MGIVVHQLITGAHPFREESDFATVRNILSRPPRSLRELAPDIPPAFDAAVLKALARSPSDRFATALEFREAIAAAVPPAPRHEIAACLEALVGMFARERHEAHRTALAEAKARARPRVGPRYAALAALAVLVIGAVAMAVVASRPVDAAPSGAPAAPPATSSEIAVAPPAPSATVAPATSESPVAPAATPSVRPAARKAPSPKDPASPPATTPPSPPTATAATPAKPPVATPGF
jgi:serine/threonine-protein kinase